MRIERLTPDDLSLVGRIDRSEHVEVQYSVVDGRLVEAPVVMTEVPPWDQSGTGPFSVRDKIDFCARCVAAGGVPLGAFVDGDELAGIAVVDPGFEPDLAWFAFLHVSRPHRRRGAASALWAESVSVALDAGASSMYVSATPTGSAVGFYLRQGCRLADPVHPVLFAEEPEDIHLVYALR
ncbi:MAG TPA: GNAT family N-acetyltransferase [Acidimicrobiales bacterium]|nr:GNAT family N-acetyltransferase [Acidimicrobiales bacterium]